LLQSLQVSTGIVPSMNNNCFLTNTFNIYCDGYAQNIEPVARQTRSNKYAANNRGAVFSVVRVVLVAT
jgi:hypothetical protein